MSVNQSLVFRKLIFFCSGVALCAYAATPSVPFWKAKPRIYSRIVEDREIVVSAKKEDRVDAKLPHVLVIVGAAHMKLPLEVSFAEAKKFDELPKMTTHIVAANFDVKASELFFHMLGMGHEAKMWVRLKFDEQKLVKRVQFEVVRGQLVGLVGEFCFEDIQRLKTEISMTAQYPFAKLPWPETIVELGLEGVLKAMAFRMREYVETKNR